MAAILSEFNVCMTEAGSFKSAAALRHELCLCVIQVNSQSTAIIYDSTVHIVNVVIIILIIDTFQLYERDKYNCGIRLDIYIYIYCKTKWVLFSTLPILGPNAW